MGALNDDAASSGSDRPPSSESRPIRTNLNDTDPSLPPPDPNRPRLLLQPEPAALPDALDTPEYVAPTPPPPETEHKTFELQTVKIRAELEAIKEEGPEAQRNPDAGLRQADIPTVLVSRVQRRRSWAVVGVLVGLGVVAGGGILAVAQLTREEPVEAVEAVGTVEPGAALEAPAGAVPTANEAPATTAEPSAVPSVEDAAAGEGGVPALSAAAVTPEAPVSRGAEPQGVTRPHKGADPAVGPKAPEGPIPTITTTIPLGPPEF
jgi:hypothetical protein